MLVELDLIKFDKVSFLKPKNLIAFKKYKAVLEREDFELLGPLPDQDKPQSVVQLLAKVEEAVSRVGRCLSDEVLTFYEIMIIVDQHGERIDIYFRKRVELEF